MKADFEKGTKVCSKCRAELPLSEFYKDGGRSDGLYCYCKRCTLKMLKCSNDKHKYYKHRCTFAREKKRGNGGMMIRDYELTKEQLRKRNMKRKGEGNTTPHGIMVWYDGLLEHLDTKSYMALYKREYMRQYRCAVRGYVGRVEPSEHFLFDFDLEQMLKDNACVRSGKTTYYISKWWKGEIRHWTVKDGIWKKRLL